MAPWLPSLCPLRSEGGEIFFLLARLRTWRGLLFCPAEQRTESFRVFAGRSSGRRQNRGRRGDKKKQLLGRAIFLKSLFSREPRGGKRAKVGFSGKLSGSWSSEGTEVGASSSWSELWGEEEVRRKGEPPEGKRKKENFTKQFHFSTYFFALI